LFEEKLRLQLLGTVTEASAAVRRIVSEIGEADASGWVT